MTYLEIVPLIKLPLAAPQTYTYWSDFPAGSIIPGFAVRIPFRGRMIGGIVVSAAQAPNESPTKGLKPISDTILPFPLVLNQQITLADVVSDYYFQPRSLVFKTMAPELPEKETPRLKKLIGSFTKEASLAQAVSFSKELAVGSKHFLDESILESVSRNLASGLCTIIMVPEIPMVWRMKDILENRYDQEQVAMFHGLVAPGEQLGNWLDALSGKAKIILGTRQAVFAPAPALGSIVIDAEHSISHKQWDMNPRYDARVVAEKRSQIEGCRLLYCSTSPRIATYHDFHAQGFPIKPERRFGQMPDNSPKIIDMRQELKSGNFSVISETLRNCLEETLEAGKQALIIVKRKGFASFVLCRDCGHIEHCPNCSSPLFQSTAVILNCPNCAFKKDPPLACPRCGSTRLKSFGIGIDQAKEKFAQAFPNASISVIHRDLARKKTELKKIYQSFDTGKTDILVGSPIALSWKPFNLGLIAFLNIDSILFSRDWQAHERAYSVIADALGGEQGIPILIQTYNPENSILKLSAKTDFEYLFQTEIETRELLSYPPFSKLIKLFYRSDEEKNGEDEATRVMRILASVPETKSGLMEAIGPIKPSVAKVRGKFLVNIILKIRPNTASSESFHGRLFDIIRALPSGWIIDVDPESLM